MGKSDLLSVISIGAGILAPFTGGISLGAITLSQALYATSIIAGAISANMQAEEIKRKMQKGSGHLLNRIDTKSRIPLVYGKCRVGGNIVYRATRGSDNKELYQAYSLSEGQISEVIDIYFDGHLPSFTKLIEAGQHLWKYQIENNVDRVKFIVNLGEKDPIYPSLIPEQVVFDVNKDGTPVVKTSNYGTDVQVTFNTDGTLIIEQLNNLTNTIITSVEKFKFSSNGGLSWFKSSINDELFDYIWFDGTNWYKYDSTNDTWIVDNDPNTNPILGAIHPSLNADGFDFSKINNPPVSVLVMKFKAKVGTWTGVPQVSALIEGIKKPNPFNGNTVEVIKNPVWVLFDYLTSDVYGLGIDPTELEGWNVSTQTFSATSSWKKAYDYCEAKNLSFNGVFTDGKAFDIIQQILDHFLGYIIKIDGKWHCFYKYYNPSDTAWSNPLYNTPIKDFYAFRGKNQLFKPKSQL